jgi:UDP-N-acetylmuramoyl-tripeptide--D-alanyl-D-alanine ligase
VSGDAERSPEVSQIWAALGSEQHEAGLRVRPVAPGAFVLDIDGEANRDTVAAALRVLAVLGTHGYRTVAVLGEFDSSPLDYVEEHDAVGRLVVRLNIAKLIAVGHEARHLQAAAGLEGSWNGESVIVATPEEAYDLLREEIRENDVVLVKAARRVGLGNLGDRLAEVMSW